MTSIVNTAVTAIVAALQSGTPVAAQIARVRLRPMAQAAAQAVVVRPIQSQVTEAAMLSGYPVSWTTAVSVECYARSTVATTADVAVDALLESVYARLMADPTLGGAVLGLQPQEVSFDFDADGEQTTCATLVFHARHRSAGSTFS
jgi:hypothetical protein